MGSKFSSASGRAAPQARAAKRNRIVARVAVKIAAKIAAIFASPTVRAAAGRSRADGVEASARSFAIRAIALRAVAIAALLGLWQWGAGQTTAIVLPSPGETRAALGQLWSAGVVGPAVAATAFHALAGFGLAALAGVGLGAIAGWQPVLRHLLAPLATALLGAPPIAWLVLAMVWFGLGHGTSVFAVAVTVGPLLFAAAADAAATLDPRWLELARAYGLRGRSRLLLLDGPYLASRLLPAFASGLGLAWRVAILSEVLVAARGIGAELNVARANLDTATAIAWIAIIVALVLLSDGLLRLVQRWLAPWQATREIGAVGG